LGGREAWTCWTSEGRILARKWQNWPTPSIFGGQAFINSTVISTNARLHYKAIIENYPDSGIVPDAVFQIGRGYMQQGEFVDAVSGLKGFRSNFPITQS